MENTFNEYTVDMKAINQMYRKLYWSQIFNFKTSWGIKWIAIKSLRIIWLAN